VIITVELKQKGKTTRNGETKQLMQTILIAAMLSALAAATSGAVTLPCPVSALAAYDAAGFSCSEGPLSFSNFSFSATGTTAPLITDGTVEVIPETDGFDFQAAFSAPSGTSFDAVLGYTVMISPGSFTADQLVMAGFGISGSGSIDISETVCVGALFDPSHRCPATTVSLNVFDNSGGFKASDSSSFAPATPSTLGIIKDLSVVGGTGLSSAQVSLVDNVTPFAAVPVPETSTFALLGAALIACALVRSGSARP
jgi:hypothetical protein